MTTHTVLQPHDGVGPSFPFQAKTLARLKLNVLRRVLPKNDLKTAISALEDCTRTMILGCGEWKSAEHAGSSTHFGHWFKYVTFIDCDECDGSGDFVHGSHWYECRECDGEGSSQIVLATGRAMLDGTVIEVQEAP